MSPSGPAFDLIDSISGEGKPLLDFAHPITSSEHFNNLYSRVLGYFSPRVVLPCVLRQLRRKAVCKCVDAVTSLGNVFKVFGRVVVFIPVDVIDDKALWSRPNEGFSDKGGNSFGGLSPRGVVGGGNRNKPVWPARRWIDRVGFIPAPPINSRPDVTQIGNVVRPAKTRNRPPDFHNNCVFRFVSVNIAPSKAEDNTKSTHKGLMGYFCPAF